MNRNDIRYEIEECYDYEYDDICVDFNIFYRDEYVHFAYYSQHYSGMIDVNVDVEMAKELFEDELDMSQDETLINIEVNKKGMNLLMEMLGEHTDEFVDAVNKMRARKAIDNKL